MLKGEENGAELYDSLQRLLHGSSSSSSSLAQRSKRDETEPDSARPGSTRASGLQLQLCSGTYQHTQGGRCITSEEWKTTTGSEKSNTTECRTERKPALWNADTHLHLMKLCETYRDCYSFNLWLLNPLHPAALEDDNIRYIMCTDEGSEERSPLSLSIYWILYSGALMEGHIERASEFYSVVREHLSFVFDQTDSSISLVLLPMAYHSRFWADTEDDGLAKCAYYLTLAMEICKRVGCLGSSVYISCLQMYAWFCMTDNNSLSYEEKLQEVKKGSYYPTMPMSLHTTAIPRNAKTSVHIPISHLQIVEKMFGVVGNIMKGIFIFKSTIYPESIDSRRTPLHFAQDSPVPTSLSDYQQYQSQPFHDYSHKRKQPEEYQSSNDADDNHYFDFTADYSPAKVPRQKTSCTPLGRHAVDLDSQLLRGSEPFAGYANTFLPNTTLQPLLLPLDTMDKDLELLMQSDNPLPTNIYMMFKLWIVGERAECLWCMGQPQEALQMALYFLEVSKHSTKNFISHYVSIQPILEMVLAIFLSMYRFNEFQELVHAILEPLDPSIPHVARSKARYQSALLAAYPGLSEIDIDGNGPHPNGNEATTSASRSGDNLSDSDTLAQGREAVTNGGCHRTGGTSNATGFDEPPPSAGYDSGEDSADQLLEKEMVAVRSAM